MAREEENLSITLEGSDQDEEMPTASEALASATASSSDDSGSEEEADEGADELRIQALEQALRSQPLDYDSHLQYVNCLRKSGEIEKLRNAREEMNRLFPLSPKLWQDWIGDEISLNQGAEAFAETEKLYERAVQEYLSVPLWCDYINFVQERDESVLQCSPSGATKMRELLERAIIVAGFHVTEESKIWEAYREYEQALHLTIDEENTEDKAKQNQRICSLFHRQLAVPLTNIKATLMDYKAGEADQGNSNDMDNELDGVPPNIALNYQKASAAYKARKQYEDQLSSPVRSEADKLQHCRDICDAWIKFEQEHGTLEDYDVAFKKVTTRLNDVMLFKAQQESKGKIDHSSVSVKETTSSPLKRKNKQKSSAKAQPLAKKSKQNAPKIKEKPQPDHGRVEVDSEKQLEKEEESKEIEKPKPESYNDQCTAFISSENLRTNEEDLKSIFSDCGSVTAVQLVRDKVIGKSRVSSSKRHIDFPDHLLHKKILPCLPFKYLNRLKCISKELHSLISIDAKFAADQSRSADTSSSGFVYMTDGVLSFFPDPTLIGVPDPSLSFLNPTSFYDEINLVSCTNGLLLLDDEFSHKASLCVCNPATKEMVFVPKCVDWDKYFVYRIGLAYDPCELPDRFTIVHPHYNRDRYMYQFNVFCSYTGKWTRSSTSVCVGSYSPAYKAVCAKGVIYWDCGGYLLWYDTKRNLAGSLMWPLLKPLIVERYHIGEYAGEITCCLTWVGGIKVWRLTGGSRWDRLHATSWDGMLDAFNFCDGMQLCCKSQSEMFFGQHFIFPVGFDGQFVYITMRQRKDQINKTRLFRWETETGRAEERGQITLWEPWFFNSIFKYTNSMARVPQILKETS